MTTSTRGNSLARARLASAWLLALFAAGILVVAAFYKSGDPALFAEQITAHQVTPASWSNWLAFFFIAAEFILGAALIAFVWPRLSFALTILMMLGFIGVTAWAWHKGAIRDCGCFGRLIERGPREVIVEDAVVIAASLAGMWLTRGFQTRVWRQRLFALLLLPALALIAFGTVLPTDALIVGAGPGTKLGGLTVENVPVSIEEGRVLVALVGPDCPPCEEQLPELKRVAAERIVPTVVGVYAGKASEALVWRLRNQPNFPLGNAPERVLRQYYRRLPGAFLLEDGVVRKAWWGRLPAVEEVRRAAGGN